MKKERVILYLCKDYYSKKHCFNCGECHHTLNLEYALNWDHVPTDEELKKRFSKESDRLAERWIEHEA